MIDQVRRFNRAVTQRAGALDEAFLARGRPLGQARVLWEIGPDGRDVRDLRARLDLDSGYLSRLLRALERDGLVTVEVNEADGRIRTARLTAAGGAERAELDRLSDDAAAGLLGPLSERQRGRLVTAMAEVERLLAASAIVTGVRDPRDPDARRCLRAYVEELSGRFDGGFDPARSISAADHEMIPPAGLFLVATLHGEPAGCGALKFHAGAPAEIKRMWVAPAVRGLGLGRPAAGRAGGPRRRARRPGAAAGDQPDADRGDFAVPGGGLPGGAGLQRRAVRAPLVREDAVFWLASMTPGRAGRHYRGGTAMDESVRGTSTPLTPPTARCSTGCTG